MTEEDRLLDEIRALNRVIEANTATRTTLERQLRQLQSTAYIRANRITRAQVHVSKGEGVPWHGHICSYADWLRIQPERKPWAEWNGLLYRTDDLLNDMAVHAPARYEDIPE